MTSIFQFTVRLWNLLWSKKERSRQVGIAFLTIIISLWIGFRYAKDVFVNLFPILLWGYLVFLCFIALYPNNRQSPLFDVKRNLPVAGGLLLLFFVSILLRSVQLDSLPPGLHPDESGYIEFALLHIPNAEQPWLVINPFRTGLDSQPILYKYLFWISTHLFGPSISAVKIFSVIAGAMAVLATFLMIKELTGNIRLAWLTALLMSVYHYHVHWSRLALSNIWTTLFLPLTIGMFLLGWRKQHSGAAVLAGACLGFSAYVYSGGYFVVILLTILFVRLWRQTQDHLSLTIYSAKMIAMAAVIAAPLVVFAYLVPEYFFDRATLVRGWTPQAIMAYSRGEGISFRDYFVHQVEHSFGAYNFHPEITGFYKPEIPFLVGFASILFLVGIFLAFNRKHYLALIWLLIVTILGGVMIDGTPGSTHFIGAIPAICWLVALPIDKLFENGNQRLAYALIVVIIYTDLFFYFALYKGNPSPDLTLPFPIIGP